MKPQPYSKIRLEGPRLLLRAYKFTDFKTLRASHAARLKPANKFDGPIPTSNEPDYKKHKERLLRHRAHAKQGTHYIFGAFDKKTGAYIGQIDLFVLNWRLRWANIGYHVQNQYFGQGYAVEMGRLGLAISFRKLGLHRIEAAMEPSNKASWKTAKRMGLKPEGTRLKFFAHKGGVDVNVLATNSIDFRRGKLR